MFSFTAQRIQFAKSDSDEIAKDKGTYVERPKKTQNMKREAQAAIDSLDSRRARKKAAKEASKAQQKPKQPSAAANNASAAYTQPRPYQASMGEQPPNQILFLTNLPAETTEKMLQMLFAQFVLFFSTLICGFSNVM